MAMFMEKEGHSGINSIIFDQKTDPRAAQMAFKMRGKSVSDGLHPVSFFQSVFVKGFSGTQA